MLQRLELRNFQAHDKLIIDLDPNITTITGPSDVGKSSIIRALRWLLTNRPGGESFITHGFDDCSVTLVLDGTFIINRKRGKGINRYNVNGKEFTAFGNDVPPEIAKLCNISDLNFQLQHDSPFWFSQSAGEVSRQLNSIINLGAIDSTLSNLNSRIRETTTKITVCEQRWDKAKTDRKTHLIAALMDDALKEVEQRHTEARLVRTRATEIDDLVKKGSGYQKKIIASLNASQAASRVVKLGQVWEKTKLLKDFMTQLSREGRRLSKIQMPKGMTERIKNLEVKEQKMKIATQQEQVLKAIIYSLDQKQEEERRLGRELKMANKEFKQKMGDICPLCERKL